MRLDLTCRPFFTAIHFTSTSFSARLSPHNGSRTTASSTSPTPITNGVGTVFNESESVEGYTSIAWLGLLSIARVISDLVGSSASFRQLTLLLSHALMTALEGLGYVSQ